MTRHGLLAVIATATLATSNVWGQAARNAAPIPPKTGKAIPADAPMYGRQGTWFGFGLGAGSTSLHCRICADSGVGSRGTSGYVRVGTTVNGRLLVGAELNGWMRSDQDGHQRVFTLTGDGYWYPNPRHGYFFKGGLGLSRYKQWSVDKNNKERTNGISTGGLTGQVGVGYEMRVNPKMSFVPFFNLIGTARGTLSTESNDGAQFQRNRLDTKANVLFLQLGMGLTWH